MKGKKRNKWVLKGLEGCLLVGILSTLSFVSFASGGNPAQGVWNILKELLEPVIYCFIAIGAFGIIKNRKISEGVVFVVICIFAMILIFHPEVLKRVSDVWSGKL